MESTAAPGIEGKLEPKRMVGVAFVVFAFTFGMFLSRVVAALFGGLRLNDRPLLGVEDLTVSAVLGFAVAVGLALWGWFDPRIHTGSLDIAAELKRVTWPSLGETRVSTVAVLVASLVSSVFLFVFDLISSKVMTEWVPGLLGWMARI